MSCQEILRKVYLRFPIEDLIIEKYRNQEERFRQLVRQLGENGKIKSHIHREGTPIGKMLNQYTYEELLVIIEESDSITIDDCNRVFEEYKYGFKPTFEVFTINNNQAFPDISNIYEHLRSKAQKYSSQATNSEEIQAQDAPLFIKPVFFEPEHLKESNIYEISFSLGEKYIYVDEDGHMRHIYEYQTGFIWFNFEKMWFAIRSVSGPFVDFVRSVLQDLGIKHSKLIVPEGIIDQILDRVNLKAASLIVPIDDEYYPKKMRMADPELHRKQLLREAPGYRTSSMYSVELNSGRHTHVRLSQTKGRVSTTHVLKTSELRELGPKLINDIIDKIDSFTSDLSVDTIVNDLKRSEINKKIYHKFKNLSSDEQQYLYTFVADLIYLLKSSPEISSVSLQDWSINKHKLLVKTGWVENFFLIEVENNDQYFYECVGCGSYRFKYREDGVPICSKCSTEVSIDSEFSSFLMLKQVLS